jgi:hypothetical protein
MEHSIRCDRWHIWFSVWHRWTDLHHLLGPQDYRHGQLSCHHCCRDTDQCLVAHCRFWCDWPTVRQHVALEHLVAFPFLHCRCFCRLSVEAQSCASPNPKACTVSTVCRRIRCNCTGAAFINSTEVFAAPSAADLANRCAIHLSLCNQGRLQLLAVRQ